MKKFFSSNAMLKIGSLVIAIILWYYIVFILDSPSKTIIRNIPIQFIGVEQLTQRELAILNESAASVDATIEGSRKNMGKYTVETMIARVDVSGLYGAGTYPENVKITTPSETVKVIDQNVDSVEITIEKLKEKNLNLEVTTTGSLAEDYMAGPITTNPESVTISGPESVIDKIAKAGVTLDYDRANVDISTVLPIRFYDATGKELPSADTLLKRLQRSTDTTQIRCDVVKLRHIPVKPQFTADAPEALQTFLEENNYSLDPQEVLIYGDDALTAKVTEIQTEPIRIERFKDNDKAKVKLMISENVKILKDISEVELTIKHKESNTNDNKNN